MRRLRVTASMQRQLASLRDERTGTSRLGGVMKLPRILPMEEWERLASAQQDFLIAASAEDRAKPKEPAAHPEATDEELRREHERNYQEARAKAAEGGLPLVRAREERLRRLVTR
jgi:hypothetical protein